MNKNTWKIAWDMLSGKERKMAGMVLAIAILGACAQVLMVGSIMPFLTHLSDPGAVADHPMLLRVQSWLGLETPFATALFLGLCSIGIILISSTLLLMRAYAIARFTLMRVHTISSKLLSSYLRRPYEYFLDRNSGDLGKRILAETNEIAVSFLQPAAEMVSSLIAAIFILGFIFYISPVATISGALCVLVLYFGIYRWAGRYLNRVGERRVEANRQRFAVISEVFGGLKDIKTSQTEQVFQNRFEKVSAITLRAQLSSRVAAQAPQFIIQGCFFSGVIIACLVVVDPEALEAGTGSLTGMLPLLGVFAFAGQRIVPELQKIYASASKISYGAAALRNVHEDLLRAEASTPLADLPFQKSFGLESISYRYPNADRGGISSFSAEIKKGQRIGIVGGTGAGKTTLVDLMLGLLSPKGGRLTVDGERLESSMQIEAWKRKIAYVPQSIFLLDASFAENIAFGVPSELIDHERVVACAKIAQIHDIITEQHAEGYAAMTGDRGVKLSGGQRQRIGIARALYREADLIILDEATSALDGQTERQVIQAIEALPRDITLVMIAHRLTTLKGCDRIWVLEDGKLVEDGPWARLEEVNGPFSRIIKEAMG